LLIATARLGILSEAKIILESISSHTKEIKDIIELIDREYDLVKRNISKSLSALRERMLYLYLQVIQKETGSQIEPNE
jgi:restriction endonuclease S subunit